MKILVCFLLLIFSFTSSKAQEEVRWEELFHPKQVLVYKTRESSMRIPKLNPSEAIQLTYPQFSFGSTLKDTASLNKFIRNLLVEQVLGDSLSSKWQSRLTEKAKYEAVYKEEPVNDSNEPNAAHGYLLSEIGVSCLFHTDGIIGLNLYVILQKQMDFEVLYDVVYYDVSLNRPTSFLSKVKPISETSLAVLLTQVWQQSVASNPYAYLEEVAAYEVYLNFLNYNENADEVPEKISYTFDEVVKGCIITQADLDRLLFVPLPNGLWVGVPNYSLSPTAITERSYAFVLPYDSIQKHFLKENLPTNWSGVMTYKGGAIKNFSPVYFEHPQYAYSIRTQLGYEQKAEILANTKRLTYKKDSLQGKNRYLLGQIEYNASGLPEALYFNESGKNVLMWKRKYNKEGYCISEYSSEMQLETRQCIFDANNNLVKKINRNDYSSRYDEDFIYLDSIIFLTLFGGVGFDEKGLSLEIKRIGLDKNHRPIYFKWGNKPKEGYWFLFDSVGHWLGIKAFAAMEPRLTPHYFLYSYDSFGRKILAGSNDNNYYQDYIYSSKNLLIKVMGIQDRVDKKQYSLEYDAKGRLIKEYSAEMFFEFEYIPR